MPYTTTRAIEIGHSIRERLRVVGHDRSMEEKLRVVLRQAVETEAGPDNLDEAIRTSFASVHGVELVRLRRAPRCGRLELD